MRRTCASSPTSSRRPPAIRRSWTSWEYNRAPIGTGPWVVKEWKAGDQIVYAKNPNYREEGKPYLDRRDRQDPAEPRGRHAASGHRRDRCAVGSDRVRLPGARQDEGPGRDAGSRPSPARTSCWCSTSAIPKVDAPADPAGEPAPDPHDLQVRQAIQMGIDKLPSPKACSTATSSPAPPCCPSVSSLAHRKSASTTPKAPAAAG